MVRQKKNARIQRFFSAGEQDLENFILENVQMVVYSNDIKNTGKEKL